MKRKWSIESDDTNTVGVGEEVVEDRVRWRFMAKAIDPEYSGRVKKNTCHARFDGGSSKFHTLIIPTRGTNLSFAGSIVTDVRFNSQSISFMQEGRKMIYIYIYT